jgi:hypothetical protein
LSHDECELDLELFLKDPVGYVNEKFSGPGYPLGGNYRAVCVDESKKAKLQERYELIRFDIDNEDILGLQTLHFSTAPRAVKRIARFSIMSNCLFASWKSHGHMWLGDLAIVLSRKCNESVESLGFQHSVSKKRIDTIRERLSEENDVQFGNNEHHARNRFRLAVKLYVLCHSPNDLELAARFSRFALDTALPTVLS